MSRSFVITLSTFLGFCLSLLGYRFYVDLHTETTLRSLEKDIIVTVTKNPEANPWPLIQTLRVKKVSLRQLKKRPYELLRQLTIKQAHRHTDIIEAALHERNYPQAYRHLQLLEELVRVFGNDIRDFPPVQCLKDAYVSHPFEYVAQEDDPAFRWTTPPPLRLCTHNPESP